VLKSGLTCGYCISKLDFAANSLPIYCISKLGKREVWPKIKPAINHGKPVYVVDARIAGTGERRFFQITTCAAKERSLEHYRRQKASVPVDEAVRQLIASKRAAGRAESYLYVLNLISAS
jgi:hypothetical protein